MGMPQFAGGLPGGGLAIAPGGGDGAFLIFGEAVAKNGVTTQVWNLPADVQDGDIVFLFLGWTSSTVGPTASFGDWTMIQVLNSGATIRGSWFWKEWNTGDPMTVSVTTTVNAIYGLTFAARGLDVVTPTIDADGGRNTGASATAVLGIIAGGGDPDQRLIVGWATSGGVFSSALLPVVTNGPIMEEFTIGVTSGVASIAYGIWYGDHGGDSTTITATSNAFMIGFTTYLDFP